MAEEEKKQEQIPSVTLSNPFQKGIDEAMERIESFKGRETLVSEIDEEMWASWDASQEDALVSDDLGGLAGEDVPEAA